MRLKPFIPLCVGLISLLAIVGSLAIHLRRENRDREVFYRLLREPSWGSDDLTERENRQRRQAKLNELRDLATRVLSADLEMGGTFARWREKVPLLGSSFKRPSNERPEDVRRRAAYFLAELGPAAKPAIPTLVKVLGNDMADIQASAAFALGQIGDSSDPILAALKKAAANSVAEVAFAAELSLWRLTDAEEHRQRADSMIPSATVSASGWLRELGSTSVVFAPTLRRVRDQLTVDATKGHVVAALWEATSQKQEALKAIEEIAEEMENYLPSKSGFGMATGEAALLAVAPTFDGEPELRAAMLPLLDIARFSESSTARLGIGSMVRFDAQRHFDRYSKLGTKQGSSR